LLNLSGRELFTFPDRPQAGFGRGAYLEAGLALMVLKYAVDAMLVYVWTGEAWSPADYVLSMASLQNAKAARFPSALSATLLLWTLPFIWIGVVLSVRRARDARAPLWLIVLFFIPGANYVLMGALALWPTAGDQPGEEVSPAPSSGTSPSARWAGVAAGLAAGVMTGVSLGASGALTIETYGLSLFIGTPFVTGVATAFVARKVDPQAGSPIPLVACTMLLLAATFVLVAFEGIVCLIMAAPLMVPIGLLGGLLGHSLAGHGTRNATIALFLMMAAGGQVVDAAIETEPLREVLTTEDIAAPPEIVWRHVVTFSEIPTPPAWYFRTGLAYPLRARIEGAGVGAVRYCEFTTGAFVEPITAWEEPTRLAFDVAAQPPPLREWSPYRNVYAPHLEGFFSTSRGEFRLVRLSNGHTRLEGRTWYALRMQPQAYWTVVADAILHRVHHRVLTHIREQAESFSRR
jgi:hypothetical protein